MKVRLAAFALISATTQAHGAISDGTYSNACVYPETMDLGGIELVIHASGAKPSASLQVCQGGCWQEPVSDLVLRGDRMTFSAADQDFNEEGALAATTVHHFTGLLRNGVLIVRSGGYLPPQRLKKQTRTDPQRQSRQAIGNDPTSWPAPVRRCR